MRQKKIKTTEKETRHQRRHDSLHCPRVKCVGFDAPAIVIKQLVHAFSCALSSYGARAVWRALKKLELPSAIASGNSYASFVLSKLPTCSMTP